MNTYSWNARNQLVAINGPISASLSYDGTGRRRSKTINGATTSFQYDGIKPVQARTATAVVDLLHGLGIDQFFARTDSAGTHAYFSDALGSTVSVTDAAGGVEATYTYEPFGADTMSGATTNTYTFTGREADETGLYYFRARYYHSESGAVPQ